jgi:hypothetical protein
LLRVKVLMIVGGGGRLSRTSIVANREHLELYLITKDRQMFPTWAWGWTAHVVTKASACIRQPYLHKVLANQNADLTGPIHYGGVGTVMSGSCLDIAYLISTKRQV